MTEALETDASAVRCADGLEPGSKRCSTCRVVKPPEEFYINNRAKDGRCGICKPCACEKSKAWTKANRARANQNSRNQYWKDPERSRAYHRKKSAEHWRRNLDENRAKNREKMRSRYRENPRYFLKYSAKWQAKNMKKHAEINKAWRSKHPDKWDVISARSTLSKRSSVSPNSWPAELVEAVVIKRKLIRLCRSQQTSMNSETNSSMPSRT